MLLTTLMLTEILETDCLCFPYTFCTYTCVTLCLMARRDNDSSIAEHAMSEIFTKLDCN